jgi:DNA-binding MarR family transcriptional regulator
MNKRKIDSVGEGSAGVTSKRERPFPVEDARRAQSFYADNGADFDPAYIGPLWHVLGLAQMISTDVDRILRPGGLTFADLVLLGTIRIAAPAVLRASDLASKLHISEAALSGRIARLERLGLVQRHKVKADRRAQDIMITDAGATLSDQATRVVARQASFAQRFRQLPEAEREALITSLGQLHDLVDRDFLPVSR